MYSQMYMLDNPMMATRTRHVRRMPTIARGDISAIAFSAYKVHYSSNVMIRVYVVRMFVSSWQRITLYDFRSGTSQAWLASYVRTAAVLSLSICWELRTLPKASVIELGARVASAAIITFAVYTAMHLYVIVGGTGCMVATCATRAFFPLLT